MCFFILLGFCGKILPSLPKATLLLLLLLEKGVVLLEALAQTLRPGHMLLDAPRHAARLLARERLGAEVVDARHEAVVYEVAEELFCFVRGSG